MKDMDTKDNPSTIIDQFAALHEALAHDLDRYEALKKQVSAMAAQAGGNDAITLHGRYYMIDYSAPSNTLKCAVDAKVFVKKTGAWAALTVSTTEARKLLSPEQLETFFNSVPGARRFKRVRRSPYHPENPEQFSDTDRVQL